MTEMIPKNRTIDNNSEDKLSYCFQCGSCTSICPSARYTGGFNPRRIILKISSLGIYNNISNEQLWLCSDCRFCDSLCPQEVQITNLFFNVKNKAFKEGKISDGFISTVKAFMETGIIGFHSAVDYYRKRIGLGSLRTLGKFEVQEIMKRTDLSNI